MQIDVLGSQHSWLAGRGYGVGHQPEAREPQAQWAPDAEPNPQTAPANDKEVAGAQEVPPAGAAVGERGLARPLLEVPLEEPQRDEARSRSPDQASPPTVVQGSPPQWSGAELREVTVLTEPGGSRADGVAYNKYLAIYNRMRDMNDPTGLVGAAVELDLSV
jgi:hypothetical protein